MPFFAIFGIFFLALKNLGPERFGSKKIWGPKKVGAKKCRLKNSGPKKLRPLKNCLVKIGSVIAKIFLIWTNVARTNITWTNVTLTVGIC